MRQMYRLIVWLIMLCLPLSTLAFPREDRVPGGLAVIELKPTEGQSEFSFRGRPVLVVQRNANSFALVGLPLNLKPGEYFIEASSNNSSGLLKKFFKVKNKEYSTQHITIKDKRKVNPYAKDMDRILAEKKRKQEASKLYSTNLPDVNFLLPLKGISTGSFGRRRVFNGQSRRPHSGMDIAADTGTNIIAPASGTVIEAGDFFFSGNLVYLDHGRGLISLYAHLNEINVSIGDTVEKGQIIGKVGETGRVTGPHLHWSLGLNGTWINPELFLPIQE
ncbi:MAG: murein DD-endopeptidase MepM/ murein hydrolase activator NlpD [Gammaproteobacteria bacterium]|jgi:murein DD-endopeptidase MepM/ murein hydrolase activator NlpD